MPFVDLSNSQNSQQANQADQAAQVGQAAQVDTGPQPAQVDTGPQPAPAPQPQPQIQPAPAPQPQPQIQSQPQPDSSQVVPALDQNNENAAMPEPTQGRADLDLPPNADAGIQADPGAVASPSPEIVPSPTFDPTPAVEVGVESGLTAANSNGMANDLAAIDSIEQAGGIDQASGIGQASNLGTSVGANGLPDLPEQIHPGSVVAPPSPTPPSSMIGELNSANIMDDNAADPNFDQTPSSSSNSTVNLDVSEDGVKTITGPAMKPIPSAAKTMTNNSLGADTAKPEVNTATPVSTASAPEGNKSPAVKIDIAAGEKLPTTSTIEDFMSLAETVKASDIHFTANYPVTLRIDGKLKPVSDHISAEQSHELGMQLLADEAKQKFDKEKELDFSFTNENDTRFRVNLFVERGNTAGALRLIEKHIRSMKELDLPQIMFDIVDEPHGLVLVVGPTGSGKSTTLAAMINHINQHRAEHILTIEDPIEYVYPVANSIINQREVGADTMEWQRALKSALREDPDVVLVGEMRDLSTIESTITIAETGHLTFATLHTNSAAQAIDRIIDVFPEGSKEQIRAQLANVLTAVVSQRLIPVQSGGRRAALEVMLGTVAVRNAIREGKTYQIDNIIQTSGDLGMITLEKSLVNMVKQGHITREMAKSHTPKPDEIDSLMSNR